VARVWTENARFGDVYFDLMENIKLALDESRLSRKRVCM
jgi:hypothetical protein